MPATTTARRIRLADEPSTCRHQADCNCVRPQLGRAVVTAVGAQVAMAIIAMAGGATAVGLVACVAIGGCAWLAVIAEVVCFYRIGLGETAAHDPERTRSAGYRHEHSTW